MQQKGINKIEVSFEEYASDTMAIVETTAQ
jgi:hypothetical protein